MSLSRLKQHGVHNAQILVCADCGAADPGWAVLNRGVLVCNDCCSVHRGLGRDISQIRSLKNGSWHQNEMTLVNTLYCNGSNNVWEHALLDPNSPVARSVRKPSPRDPVYPSKNDFITCKYKQLMFMAKQSPDEAPMQWHDMNRQMWACVRTGHVETTLRMLAIGASPNYKHNNGCTPLHVAAKENQMLQVELLFLYGGDVCERDDEGLTPRDYALRNGHNQMAERLMQLAYECTDRLSMYLTGRRPDHKTSHFVIAEMAAAADRDQPAVMIARRRMQALSHEALEHLIQDVYDEVERRENDLAWQTAMAPYDSQAVNERYIVPFLPVNNNISATRNQSRQKLAKLDAREFAALIIDVLTETRRRYNTSAANAAGTTGAQQHDSRGSADLLKLADANTSGSEPAVVHNASVDVMQGSAHSHSLIGPALAAAAEEQQDDKSLTAGPQESLVQLDDYMELREKIDRQHQLIQTVLNTNNQFSKQLADMEAKVDRLSAENAQLRASVAAIHNKQPMVNGNVKHHDHDTRREHTSGHGQPSRHQQRGTRERTRSPTKAPTMGTGVRRATTPPTGSGRAAPVQASQSTSHIQQHASSQPPLFKHQFASARVSTSPAPESISAGGVDKETLSLSSAQLVREVTNGRTSRSSERPDARQVPYPDNLILQTEQLTGIIQKLLADAQHGSHQHFNTYAQQMSGLVDSMVAMVPTQVRHSDMDQRLSAMVESCVTLKVKCAEAQRSEHKADTQSTAAAVQAAYAVASHAKHVLSIIQHAPRA